MSNLKISPTGLQLIKHYESIHDGNLSKIGLQPKTCPAGIWTIGYGHAVTNENGAFLRGEAGYKKLIQLYPHWETMTIKEAEDLLDVDIIKFERQVNKDLKISISQNQFDALVSHTFNTGGSDNLFALINGNSPFQMILDWFTNHYITANGIPSKGLKFRRQSEAVLFQTGELKFFN
jgi:lysozyme